MVFFCLAAARGQSIDFSLLTGTWHCYMRVSSIDSTADDCYITFQPDLTYAEERRYYHNTTKGTYSLDKKNKRLSFKNLVSATKYPDAKVKMEDLVMKISLEDQIIISLNKDELILLLKKLPNSELQADTRLLLKRAH